MALVRPFRGITYNSDRFDDLGSIVTPPYDVISPGGQERYYSAHPYNVIRLELGRTGPEDTNLNNRYTRAARTFTDWLAEGALVRGAQPCFYVTAQDYQAGKVKRTRWGIVARVRIEDAGSGVVLPHEQTFSAHKTDRFRLMEACRAQFSQVFSVYQDPKRDLEEAFTHCRSLSPEVSFSAPDGSSHRMWAVSDPEVIGTVEDLFRDRTLYIADGHHRYETARNYRDMVRGGKAPSVDGPHEYVMMYLSSMDDEGLTILPYHRLLSAGFPLDVAAFADCISRWFTVEEQSAGRLEPAVLESRLAASGNAGSSFAVFAGDDLCLLLRLKPDADNDMARDLHPALRRLDVQVLSELVFGKALGLTPEDLGDDGLFQFDSSIESCLAKVGAGQARAAFLLNPTPIEDVREVALAGLVMPRKSTYFHPKVITGLVLNPLDDDGRD